MLAEKRAGQIIKFSNHEIFITKIDKFEEINEIFEPRKFAAIRYTEILASIEKKIWDSVQP